MYETEFLKIKPEVLETIHANLLSSDRKIEVTIEFDTQEHYDKFFRAEQDRKIEADREVQMVSSDGEDQADDNALNQNVQDGGESDSAPEIASEAETTVSNLKGLGEEPEIHHNDIRVDIEKIIVYKNYYSHEFQKVALSHGVKIVLLSSSRIKFSGEDIEAIEDAMQDVNRLIKNIHIRRLSKESGFELSQSPSVIRSLKEHSKAQLSEILNKPFVWYDVIGLRNEDARDKVNRVQKFIVDAESKHHKILALHDLDRHGYFKRADMMMHSRHKVKPMYFKSLQTQVFKQIFLQELGPMMVKGFSPESNQKPHSDSFDNIVELSKDEKSLIIHSISEQLSEITSKVIKQFYEGIDWFYIRSESVESARRIAEVLEKYTQPENGRNLNEKSFSLLGNVYDSFDQTRSAKGSDRGKEAQDSKSTFIHYLSNLEQRALEEQESATRNLDGKYHHHFEVDFCIAFHKPHISSSGPSYGKLLQDQMLADSQGSQCKEFTLSQEQQGAADPTQKIEELSEFFKQMISEIFEATEESALRISVIDNPIFRNESEKSSPVATASQNMKLLPQQLGQINMSSIPVSKFETEKELQEPILHIKPKQQTEDRYLSIVDEYLLKKYQRALTKINEEKQQKEAENLNQSQSINITTVINDSTMLADDNEGSINQSHWKGIENQSLPDKQSVNNGQSFMKELSKADNQKLVADLKKYSVFIEETHKEYNNKYLPLQQSQEVNEELLKTYSQTQIVTRTDKRNRSDEEQLQKLLELHYYVKKIQLHSSRKHEPGFYSDSQALKSGRIITVFVKKHTGLSLLKKKDEFMENSLMSQNGLSQIEANSKSAESQSQSVMQSITQEFVQENAAFSAWLLCKANHTALKNDGFLLNVRKEDIFVEGEGLKVRIDGHYELAKAIEYLK